MPEGLHGRGQRLDLGAERGKLGVEGAREAGRRGWFDRRPDRVEQAEQGEPARLGLTFQPAERLPATGVRVEADGLGELVVAEP